MTVQSAATFGITLAQEIAAAAASMLLALFFALLTMYFGLRRGNLLRGMLIDSLPLRPEYTGKLIEEFRAKGGKGVAQLGDALLLLHHTGARTGTERVNPLAYYDDGDRLVIVASKGGSPENAAW